MWECKISILLYSVQYKSEFLKSTWPSMMIIATTICCRNVSKPHAVTLKKSIFYNPIRLMVPVRIFFLLLLLPCIYDWSDSCLNGSVSCRSLLVQFMFCVLQVITGTVYVLCLAGHYWYSLCSLCVLAVRPTTGVWANGPVPCCLSLNWLCFREPWFVNIIQAWYCGTYISKQFKISWVYYGHLRNEPIIFGT